MRARRFLALFFVPFAIGCTKGAAPKPAPPPPVISEPAEDVISTFTLVGHSEAGRKKWEVTGQTANLLAETVELSPVTAVNFGKVDVTLTSSRGKFHKASRNVELKEDVVVITSDGARLSTDTFFWAAERGVGTTPDWVTITRPGMRVVGQGAVGHPSLKRVRLKKEITVTLVGQGAAAQKTGRGPGGGKTVITCEGPMQVDYGRDKIRFLNQVVVRDARGTIHADRMDVTLDPDTNRVRRVACLGDVVIRQEGRISYADRADYWQPEGNLRLMGHPRIVVLAASDLE